MDDLFVGSLMTSPVETVTADATVRDAARTLLEQDIGSVLVVGPENELDGIFTATDCARVLADGAAVDTTVGEYMTTVVTTTTANASIRDAADALLEHGVHHLPVVDDTEGVVGIVTTTDLTAYVSRVQEPSPETV